MPRWLSLRRVLTALALALALGGGVVLAQGWWAFGHGVEGERLERVHASPQWHGRSFDNPQPLHNEVLGSLTGALHLSDDVSPHGPLPVEPFVPFDEPRSGLRVTWLGHSSTLVELDGARVLTDPVWSDRVSPLPWVGPRRWYPNPIPFEALPPIDAVVISHDHYDHLDAPTLARMKDWPTRFFVPLGVGAHLEYWGIDKAKIVELDWWGSAQVGPLTIHCVPARHASGRVGVDYDAKLWAGWALVGPAHRVYFSGDTGLFPAMRDIGQRLGPFDLTMVEVGQYHQAWPDWHAGPEQAVRAHQLVRGRVFLPIHWGALTLAYHGWTEPIERAVREAKKRAVTILTPRPGQRVEPDSSTAPWWPTLPVHTAEEDPIVSTQLGALELE